MFRNLHMKLVLILILLIVSVMAVVGTFLINSVGNFYLEDFQEQVYNVFTTDTLSTIEEASHEENALEQIGMILDTYSSQLGIDVYSRNYYILDCDGNFLSGSNVVSGSELNRTANIVAAMAGEVGNSASNQNDYMDYAIPIGEEPSYIIYILDDKEEIRDLSWRFFTIVLQAMTFGLLAAILLSFLLSKTITTPIENITKRAQNVAAGDFSDRLAIQSSDEIGELTRTFNDMADRLHHTLDEVQGERDKLNTIFQHMTDGVAAFTSDGKLLHMNAATERLLGTHFSESMVFSDVFADMKQPNPGRNGAEDVVQTEIVRMGRTLSVLFAPFGSKSDLDRGIVAVVHDITEQRKLEDARREFVANVSHELRTPLTNIKSYTETLIDAAGELPAETEKRFLTVISNEGDRMTRIVKDLLTLSKLDYGRMDLKFVRFSMQDMLNAVYSAMVLDAEKNGHELKLEIKDTMPEMNGDRERLEQVVVNIISNSIKYTPSGGHICLRAAMRDDRHVMLQVIDDGMGIPEADIPRLFERFYRVDKARSRAKGGSGLGLAIAKEMVEAHHGTIDLQSKLDVGTTVTIVLPTTLAADNENKS